MSLHDHVARLLGADLLDGAAGIAAYSRPALDILGRGVLTPEANAQVSAAYRHLAPAASGSATSTTGHHEESAR